VSFRMAAGEAQYLTLISGLKHLAEKVPWTAEDHTFMTQGACRGYPPEWWDLDSMVVLKTLPPEKQADCDRAKQICYSCPVRKSCENFAMRFDITNGIWGGRDPGTRHGRKISITAARKKKIREEEGASCAN
jgi:hypothetical protein